MTIYFNIWDDYLEGDSTYGYFENRKGTYTEQEESEIIVLLYEKFKEKFPSIEMAIDEDARQIDFPSILYDEIEEIIDEFNEKLKYKNNLILIYSES